MRLLIIVSAFMAACAGLTPAERSELDAFRQWRAEQVAAAESGTSQQAGQPMPTTAQPTREGQPASGNRLVAPINGNPVAGTMLIRGQKDVYVGLVATEARQIRKERLLPLTNRVCDPGLRNYLTSACRDERLGESGFNSFLAFKIEGRPVICTPAAANVNLNFVHPVTGESLLGPEQTCHIGIGDQRGKVAVTITKYRNSGTSTRIELPTVPDAVHTLVIEPYGAAPYVLDEFRVP